MRASIFIVRPDLRPNCCPGHDTFPSDTYENRRSKKARSRDKKLSNKMARHIFKQRDRKDLTSLKNPV